jgi:hypothetical protein
MKTLNKLCVLSSILVTFSNAAIVTNTAGLSATSEANYYLGQSFKTPSGSNVASVSFSWLKKDGATKIASGNLVLFTQEYLGAPNDISNLTPGYIATAGASGGTSYFFNGLLTLNADTEYWVYMDGTSTISEVGLSTNSDFPNGIAYDVKDPKAGYKSRGEKEDFNFVLDGKQSPIPEPSSSIFLSVTLIGMMLKRRR